MGVVVRVQGWGGQWQTLKQGSKMIQKAGV